MFRQCNNLRISGGTFHIYHESDVSASSDRASGELTDPRTSSHPSPPSSTSRSFKVLRLGDLDLISEMGAEEIVEYHDVPRHKNKAVVRRIRVVVGMRRIYEACVLGIPTSTTAVIYEGAGLDKWRSEVEKHETFRHPSLVQLYAVANGPTLNALIYTDGLIPLNDVRELQARSPLAITYVEYGIKRDLCAAFEYWKSSTNTWLLSPGAPNYTPWIRVSTGRLCIDVGDSCSEIKHLDVKSLVHDPVSRATSLGYCEPDLDLKLISRLQLGDIHTLLCSRSGYDMAEISFRSGQVALGTIWPTSDVKKVLPLPQLLTLPTTITLQDLAQQPWFHWEHGYRNPYSRKDVVAGGWTRVILPPDMTQAYHLTTRVKIELPTRREMQKCWLSQAHSIARADGALTTNYWIPGGVKFRVSIWYPEDSFTLRGTFMADAPTSEIYLFLFRPSVDFVDGYPVISVPPPRESFYWSLDPQGRTRMAPEVSDELGIPVPYVFLESWVTGWSWDERDYGILAEFHRAKGFDPFSSAVATELGYPLVGDPMASNTSLTEVDETELEYAKRQLETYPKQGFRRRAAVQCQHCGSGVPAVQNVVLPDLEVPPIHRHRIYRKVFIRSDPALPM